jgi:heme O synthase-like polyprenyltransferase
VVGVSALAYFVSAAAGALLAFTILFYVAIYT